MFQLKTVEFVRVIFVLFDWRRDISQYIIIADSIGHSIPWTAASLNASDSFLLQFSQARRESHSGIDEPSLSTVHATLIWIELPTDRNTHTDLLNYGVCIHLSSVWFDGCHGNRTTLFIVSPLSKCLALSFQLFPIRLCLPHVCVYAIMGNKVMHRSMWS